jgi:uncharacterized small protein (DUF1192 family)
MSKTEKFNVKVRLGGVAYQPGAAVPVGGKAGLPAAEVERLHAEFGVWKGGAAAAGEAGDFAALRAENERMAAELAQLTVDNGVLASRVEELEAAMKAGPGAAGA